MEKKKLQRVIGISVVVAFVIVLIPFLFGKKEMPQQETTAQVLPDQQSTSDVTAANTATDANQVDNTNIVNPTDPNNSAQNTTNSNAEDNGITPITTPPVASNDQNATPVPVPVPVNPADTNNQAATTPTTPTPTNVTGQTTSEMNPAVNPANPSSTASTQETMQTASAVSTNANDTTLSQMSAEKAAAVEPQQQVKPKHVHKSVIAKKVAHVSEKNLANLKKPAWVVQMGSFRDKSNAHRLVDQLRSSGFKAFTHVVTASNGTVRTRVYIGPEFKQASAQQLSSKIAHDVKLQGYVVPFKPMAL